LKPDSELGRRAAEEEKARLATIRAALDESQIAGLVENTRKLKLRQEMPDPAEALETLPVLRREDLEQQNKSIPLDVLELQDTNVLYHDLFTNGIVYLDLGFDLHTLPRELLPLTEMFGRALFEMGTKTEDFVKFSQRIGKGTGGIYTDAVSVAAFGSGETVSKLFVRGKATASQAGELLSILKDALLNANFDDRERFKQMVLEEKARLEASLVPGGARFVNTRLRAQFGETGWANDEMQGIGYLFAVRKLAHDMDTNWKSVLEWLETIRELLINRQTMIGNVTLDAENWKAFQPQLDSFLAALPCREARLFNYEIQPSPRKEGLAVPAQVNYVGKGANLYDLGYQLDGSAQVITGYLRMTHLWDKVRVQGGAYGAHVVFDDRSGILTFISYRDPNLTATLDSFDQAGAFLKGLDSSRLSENELTKAIIAAIGDLDAYQLPDAKGYTAMMRYLTHRTEEMRQKTREEVLSTNGEDFVAFGEVLDGVAQSNAVAVLGSQSTLEAADIGLEVTKVL
jgi:Zn-dependent M16 (insulinase) family peptidase